MERLLGCLTLLIVQLTGVCSQRLTNIQVKPSELVALRCPSDTQDFHRGGKRIWIHYAAQAKVLSEMSLAEQRQMGVVVHERNLVVLSASVSHQGNYSCSARNTSGQFWFRLMVSTMQATQFSQTCYAPNSCTLNCPDVNTPAEVIPGINSSGITWHKVSERSPTTSYFPNVEENNRGLYTCTRHYQSHDQLYNMSFTLQLSIERREKFTKPADIISPQMGETFYVELGSTVVINCSAICSNSDDLFWLIGDTFVSTNQSLPVFYNSTSESKSEEIRLMASLVLKNVSEADLLQNYTCKLEPDNQPSRFVTISLDKKRPSPPPCYLSLALTIAFIVSLMISVGIVYAKFKIDMVLFLRDTLGCHRSSSDGKSYDAFLMCYKSDTDTGLNEMEKSFLESVLEERFGYSLCLYDRDVLPGNAASNAVLECIEQSRTVVLVPTSSDSCLESVLLSAMHSALVERLIRLVFIQTNVEQRTCSGSMSEALQLLTEAGDRVRWKGSSSMPLSSTFWKQLRYYLPALKGVKKIKLLPQTKKDVM